MKDRFWYAAITVLSCLPLLLLGPAFADANAGVQTLAGNGHPGFKDGAARDAEFVLPTAVAYDSSGRLYIADQGAQRVRMLWHGSVVTVAGSGLPTSGGIFVPGGFKDGSALGARFNEPAGLAVGGDGAIYVADELNHCIRRVKAGDVSTIAGSPERAGADDGPRTTARFTFPRGIAVDANNNIYVADYTVGVRKIDTDGMVTTLKLPAGATKQFVGVATWGTGPSLIIVAVDNVGNFYRFAKGKPAEVYGFGGVGPQPYGIAALGADGFLATDVRASVIRSVRFPQPPFVTQPSTGVVAGTALEHGSDDAGYRDGPLQSARFYNPFGIAAGRGYVAVADTGNHRIRVLPLPDSRGPVTLGSAELAPDARSYRILYIGLSHAFFDTGWETSIGARIEKKLLANRAQLGLPRPPRVSTARLDGGGLNGFDDFIQTSASDGQFDLVVLSLVPEALFRVTPPRGTTAVTGPQSILRKLDARLRASGANLFVFLMPDSVVSPVDGGGMDQPAPQNLDPAILEHQHAAIDILKGAHVPYYAALDDVLRYQREGDHRLPLWIFTDRHPSDAGREYIANEIVRQLSLMRPWSAK